MRAADLGTYRTGKGIFGGRKGCCSSASCCGYRWAGIVLIADGVAEDAAGPTVAAAPRNFRRCCSMPLGTPPAQARLGGCEPRCPDCQSSS
jgi:hypothetical protein